MPMEDILTFGELHVGHNGLGQPRMADPTEANNNTPKQLDYLLVEDLSGNPNLPNSYYKELS